MAIAAVDQVMAAFVDAEVTVNSAARHSFRAGFQVDDPQGSLSELVAEGYFDPGIRVILLTVRPVQSVLFDGIITGQELTIASDGTPSTLVVAAEDTTVMMDLRPSALERPTSPADLQALTIIAKYAATGMVPMVLPPPISNLPTPVDPSPGQGATDYRHLQTLAAGVGHVFRLQPGPQPGQSVAYFGPEIIDIDPPPPTIVVGGSGVNEIRAKLDGLLRRQIEVTIGQPPGTSVAVPVPDVSTVRPHLATRPAPKLRLEILEGTESLTAGQAALAGLAESLATTDAVRVEGTLDTDSYGHLLSPGRVVELSGAGAAYDGRYYLAQVSHRITSDRHDQDFVLRREGLGSPAIPPP
jgi:hypothetical protein